MAMYKMILTNPLGATVSNHIDTYPTPLNLTYLWGFGSLAGIALVTQIVSGVLLAMHYAAEVHIAFNSVEHIMRDVVGGWVLRYIHANGASMFFIVVYTHMFRGLYYGSYFQPRANLWYSGVVIFVLMMATAFMGYVLPWGQMSFWGATVITNLFSAIPEIGTSIVQLLWGGFSVDNPTLNRFFSLHYLLPFIIAALAFLHLILLHQPGSNNPLGVSSIYDRVPFYPYFYVKDLFGLCIFVWIFSMFVIYAPNYMGHPDNYIEANPLVTPAHIVPEWYFLPFYAILRTVPDKLGGVVLMFLAIVILAFLPVVDTSAFRSNFFKPLNIWLFWYFFGDSVSLGWIGQEIVESPFIEMGVFVTISYFAYFMPSLSFTGYVENKIIASELRFGKFGGCVIETMHSKDPIHITNPGSTKQVGDIDVTEFPLTDSIFGLWNWNNCYGFLIEPLENLIFSRAGRANLAVNTIPEVYEELYGVITKGANPQFTTQMRLLHFNHSWTTAIEQFYEYQGYWNLQKSPWANYDGIAWLKTPWENGDLPILDQMRHFSYLTANLYNVVRVNPSWLETAFVHLGLIQAIFISLFILFIGFFFEKSAALTAYLNKVSAYYLLTTTALYEASIFIVPFYTTPYYEMLRSYMDMTELTFPDEYKFSRNHWFNWIQDFDFTRKGLESWILTKRNSPVVDKMLNQMPDTPELVLLRENSYSLDVLNRGVDLWLYNGYYEMFFIIITLLFAVFFYGISDRNFISTSNELEYPILLFFFYIAALLVMLVTNLVEFVLAIEIITLGSYALAAYERKNKFSTYGGVQYFIIGSIPSALLIFSLALLYRAWGTFEYTDIAALLSNPAEKVVPTASKELLKVYETVWGRLDTPATRFNPIGQYKMRHMAEELTNTHYMVYEYVNRRDGVKGRRSWVLGDNFENFPVEALLVDNIMNHYFAKSVGFSKNTIETIDNSNITILSFLLLLANFLFKITAAPFQFWAPAVYSKMPVSSVTFLSIFTKALILLVFLKLFLVCFGAYKIVIIWLFVVCGMLSIMFGMAGAFAEKGIKRFFVYSSMGHVGYMTISLSISTMPGFEALIHYITVYVITSFVMWFILLQMGVRNKNVVQFAGLRLMNRELAGVLAIIVFSMSGIPPLGGFFIKLDVLMAMMDDSRFYTNYLLLFFSVASFFYYLRIIKILFFEEVEGVTAPSITPEISLAQNGLRFSETRQWLIFVLFTIITFYGLIVNRSLISLETEALNILINE